MTNSLKNKQQNLENILGAKLSYEAFYSKERTQAERVIFKFNGARELYKIFRILKVNISPSTIYKWGYDWDKGGTGGVIPGKHWENIARAAKYVGIMLTIDDFDPRRIKFRYKGPDSKGIKDRKLE